MSYNDRATSDFQIRSRDGLRTIYLHKRVLSTDFFTNFFVDNKDEHNLVMEVDNIEIADTVMRSYYTGSALELRKGNVERFMEIAKVIHLWEMPNFIKLKLLEYMKDNLKSILSKKIKCIADVNGFYRLFKDYPPYEINNWFSCRYAEISPYNRYSLRYMLSIYIYKMSKAWHLPWEVLKWEWIDEAVKVIIISETIKQNKKDLTEEQLKTLDGKYLTIVFYEPKVMNRQNNVLWIHSTRPFSGTLYEKIGLCYHDQNTHILKVCIFFNEIELPQTIQVQGRNFELECDIINNNTNGEYSTYKIQECNSSEMINNIKYNKYYDIILNPAICIKETSCIYRLIDI